MSWAMTLLSCSWSCNTKQALAVLSRWSWAREGTSFQTVWPRRTKRGERLTRGNTWLSAGDVKKLNRCVLGTSVAFVLTSFHSCTSTLTKAQQSNPGRALLPAVLPTSNPCKCIFILGESEDSWSAASSPKNYPSYEEGETVQCLLLLLLHVLWAPTCLVPCVNILFMFQVSHEDFRRSRGRLQKRPAHHTFRGKFGRWCTCQTCQLLLFWQQLCVLYPPNHLT